MRLPDDDLDALFGRLDLIYLKTRGRRSGREHTTELSFAYEDGALYLLASLRPGDCPPDWYRNALAAGEVRLYAGVRELQGRAEALGSEALLDILALFRAKYGADVVRRWYEAGSHLPLRIVLG